ncbi:hypothetical protein BJY04DRAFT_214766 [Aspergillus karnatakaensis]|uniref:uncharacterized protein n=1 Tax=Aspergillus karnatakaensis TaxID=1810916 RepID=UPI003CCE2111
MSTAVTDENFCTCAECTREHDRIRRQNFVPACSITRPEGTYPFVLIMESIAETPYFQFLNEDEFRDQISDAIENHIWFGRPYPIRFHIKYGRKVQAMGFRPVAPVQILIDLPLGNELTDDEMDKFLSDLPEFEGREWAYETCQYRGHGETVYRLRWFAGLMYNSPGDFWLGKYTVGENEATREYLIEREDISPLGDRLMLSMGGLID